MPVPDQPARPLAVDLRAAAGRPTGVGRYMLSVANAASAAGWEVDAYLGRVRPSGLAADIRAVQLDARGPVWHLRAWRELRRRPAVFLSTSFVVAQLPGSWALPTVLDLTTFLLPQYHTARTRLAERLLLPRALRRWPVVTCTETTAADIRRLFPHAGPITVVPPWCIVADAAEPPSMDAEAYFVFVGTLEPRKNAAVVIEATRRLRRSGRAVRLILIGGAGWNFEPLRLLIRQAESEGAVEWPGYVSDVERDRLYRGAVALVLPSHYEGFGLPLLEAMAAGVATISSDAPALVEVAGGSSLHVPASDVAGWEGAMNTLLADSEHRRRLIVLGRERAATFTPEATVAGLRHALEDLEARAG
jgi:glycosyltransferase involved in cell wall biosynthesis